MQKLKKITLATFDCAQTVSLPCQTISREQTLPTHLAGQIGTI